MCMSSISLGYQEIKPLSIPSRIAQLFSGGSCDMAVDLGTANILIYLKNRGVILNEPSLIAVDEESGKVLALGHEAKRIYGKTSRSIKCIRPMKDGVIADFAMTSLMIEHMFKKARKRFMFQKPRTVIGVPSGITQVEKRAVIDAALNAGSRKVFLVEEPMAAALGADLPVEQAVGNMIVDIGGGTTEVAIISMCGTVYSHSIRVAGDEMDEAIQRHLKRDYGLQVGIFEAERLKLVIGSALPTGETRFTRTYGRDVATGMPQPAEVSDEIIRDALSEPIAAIVTSITTALEQMNAEIAQDIISRGIFLAGGGALLTGLSERLTRETGIPFYRSQDPLSCVVRGVGKIVDNLGEMKALCIS